MRLSVRSLKVPEISSILVDNFCISFGSSFEIESGLVIGVFGLEDEDEAADFLEAEGGF